MNPTLDSKTTKHRLVAALAILFALAITTAACGDNTTDESSADVAALEAAVDELVVVCNDRDHARLADLRGVGTQDRLRDQDNVFNANVEDITVIDREISIDGDTATVAVVLEVTMGGEPSDVNQVWEYERVDDLWALSSVPDCWR